MKNINAVYTGLTKEQKSYFLSGILNESLHDLSYQVFQVNKEFNLTTNNTELESALLTWILSRLKRDENFLEQSLFTPFSRLNDIVNDRASFFVIDLSTWDFWEINKNLNGNIGILSKKEKKYILKCYKQELFNMLDKFDYKDIAVNNLLKIIYPIITNYIIICIKKLND